MGEKLTINKLFNFCKYPQSEKLSTSQTIKILPCLVRVAYGVPGNNDVAKELQTNKSLLRYVNDTCRYVRYNPHSLRDRLLVLTNEIWKLPMQDLIERLRNDSSATSLAIFEQNQDINEQVLFVITQLLMLKRCILVEQSPVPEDFVFHMFQLDSLKNIIINCLIITLNSPVLSTVVSVAELMKLIMILKTPWSFLECLVLNMPLQYRNFLLAALKVSLPDKSEPYRNELVLQLCSLDKTSVDFLLNYCISKQSNPHLIFDLVVEENSFRDSCEPLEILLSEILFSDRKKATSSWLRPFLKQFWKSKLKCCSKLSESIAHLGANYIEEQNTALFLPRASNLIKTVTCLRLLTQWVPVNERSLINLMTFRPDQECASKLAFHEYCRIVLASLILVPQTILDPEHERAILEWIKWMLYCHSNLQGYQTSPHVEALLNIGIYFLNNKDAELEKLVSSIYGMDLTLKTENFNRLRVFFTQLIFSETEMAITCAKMQCTRDLSSSSTGDSMYLPVDCFCNLMAKNTFERSHISVSSWIFSQILSCKLPLHNLLIDLIDSYVNAVINPIAPEEFSEVRFSEKDISNQFLLPFESLRSENVFASQILLLYYMLAYKETLMYGAKQSGLHGMSVSRVFGGSAFYSSKQTRNLADMQYSEKLIEMIPIRFLIQRAENFQTRITALYPKLLKLVYSQYPQLFQLNNSVSLKWFFQHSDPAEDKRSGKMAVLYDEESTPLPTAPKLLFLFEDPIKHCQDCIRSLLSMLYMTETDALNMVDAFVSILPSLLKEGVPQRMSDLVLDVWNRINACLPRVLWVRTVNVLLSGSKILAKYSINDLTVDPLIVLKCDEKVFRNPVLLTIVLRVLSAFLISSRVHLSHQIFLYSGNASATVKDSEKEDLRAALISTQESTAVQMLLEICLPTKCEQDSEKFEDGNGWQNMNLREVQGIVCSHIHQMVLEDANIIKLVHFQGYDHRLLPVTSRGIPSMHCCFDFLPELLNQPHRHQQVFAIDLVSHLVVLYTIPKAFSIAQLAVAVMATMVEVLPKSELPDYLNFLVPALGRIAKAFPPLCKDVSVLLFRIAEISWAVLGVSSSQFSMTDSSLDCVIQTDSDEKLEPLVRLLKDCRATFAAIASDCLVYQLN